VTWLALDYTAAVTPRGDESLEHWRIVDDRLCDPLDYRAGAVLRVPNGGYVRLPVRKRIVG
jgi:hypothetical protein